MCKVSSNKLNFVNFIENIAIHTLYRLDRRESCQDVMTYGWTAKLNLSKNFNYKNDDCHCYNMQRILRKLPYKIINNVYWNLDTRIRQ